MLKSCKVCGTEFKPMSSLAKVCSVPCAMQYAKEERERKHHAEQRKANRAAKASLATRGELLKKAQTAFNAFIRERDKDLPCISCGRFHNGQYHAGHYRSVGACPELRFSELNVHKQCSVCNNHRSGNLTDYRINLVSKIGPSAVEWLEGPHDPAHLTMEQIRELATVYRAKLKSLQRC